MFAIAKYKILEVLEFQGVKYGLGAEIYLEDADGEMLCQKRQAVVVRFLDPEVPEDKVIIDEVYARPPYPAPVAGATPVDAQAPAPKRTRKKSV